jgi:hypothetical protein
MLFVFAHVACKQPSIEGDNMPGYTLNSSTTSAALSTVGTLFEKLIGSDELLCR